MNQAENKLLFVRIGNSTFHIHIYTNAVERVFSICKCSAVRLESVLLLYRNLVRGHTLQGVTLHICYYICICFKCILYRLVDYTSVGNKHI